MAQGKVFIPPSISNFASIDIDGRTFHVELDPSWYLFFSRKIGSDSSLLGGDTFAIDQNIISNNAFQPHVPMPSMTNWSDGQNVLSQTAFQPRAQPNAMVNWAYDDNILANQIFGG